MMYHTASFRRFMAAFIVLAWCLSSSGCLKNSPEPLQPNIVMITIDTQRSDRLGCYGFPVNISPEIDRMAQQGIQFERVIAQCSWTRPSIGSMITSLYPRTLGLYREENEILNDKFLTLPKHLKSAGYETYGLTANPNLNRMFNFHNGFDRYAESISIFAEMKHEEGKVVYPEQLLPLAENLFAKALKWAEEDKSTPAYMQFTIMDVHECGYAVKDYNMLRYYGFDRVSNPFAVYWAAVNKVNKEIYQFLHRLFEIDGWENTIVVINSDHGEGLGSHPSVPDSMYHGRLLYESQLVVPWIIWNPSWSDSDRKLIHSTVRLLEMAPTICEMVNSPLTTPTDGLSAMPLIRGEQTELALPEYLVAESYYKGHDKICVYSDEWKYIENRDGHENLNPVELQAMYTREDGQKTDLVEQYPEIVGELKSYLDQWEVRTSKTDTTPYKEDSSDIVVDQLKAIGYID